MNWGVGGQKSVKEKKSRMTHVTILQNWLVGKGIFFYMEETGEENTSHIDY